LKKRKKKIVDGPWHPSEPPGKRRDSSLGVTEVEKYGGFCG